MDEEVKHVIDILESAQTSLINNDILKLKELSNQTLHSASANQDIGSITLAVLIYALSKIIERKGKVKIRRWGDFVKKFNSYINLAAKSIKEEKQDKYEEYLERARKSINQISVDIKPFIQEVFRKASINKASKIYEHGISMGRTAKLLGITQWELSEYTGQTRVSDEDYNKTLDIKKRAMIAMEFFS